jgi:VanZ family protein
MQQHMKALLKDNIYIIAIIVTLSILYLSLVKMPSYHVGIAHLDKLQHCFAYFILTSSWLLVFYKKNKKHLIVGCCILFGIIIEVLQNKLTAYRTGDYLDIIANSTGVFLALLILNQINKKIEVKRRKDL